MSPMNTVTPQCALRDAIDREAAAWTVRKERGLVAEEAVELAAWLASDPAHGAALERFGQVSEALDGLPPEGIAALRRAEPFSPAGARPGMRRPAAHRSWFPRLAATFAVASLAAATWVGVDHLLSQPTYSRPFATARGLQMTHRLPDGSEIQLDTATEVQVSLYRDRREVRLAGGQAMLSVQRDPDRPFHVLAGEARVTVVGTRFAVRRTDDGVKVAVEEGRVRVAAKAGAAEAASPPPDVVAGGKLIELGVGEMVSLSADGTLGAVTKVPPRGVAPWREGRLVFDDTPLGEALAEFARYGDVPVVVRDPAVAVLRITGSFEIARAGSFVAALPRVLPVKLIARDERMEIVARSMHSP